MTSDTTTQLINTLLEELETLGTDEYDEDFGLGYRAALIDIKAVLERNRPVKSYSLSAENSVLK